jgi:hypothetical protein
MKLTMRAILTFVFCMIIVPAALAKKPGAQPAVSVAGVYENFTVGKGSGDLEGMRVVLVSAGNEYHAIVQIAQGGAEDPKAEWVPAEVKGNTVSFTVGDAKFTGTVTAAGLRLKDSAGESQLLKRKPCSTYFG